MAMIEKAAETLAKELDGFDWFYDTRVEKNYIVVYVNTMNAETTKLIPNRYVKCWYVDYLLCEERFKKTLTLVDL
jgi:hypothetical protein